MILLGIAISALLVSATHAAEHAHRDTSSKETSFIADAVGSVAEAMKTPDLEQPAAAGVTGGLPKIIIGNDMTNQVKLGKRAIPNTISNGGTWQYTGCYYDNPKGSSFPVGPIVDSNRTIDNCIAYCATNGYTTAGIEATTECWCGTGSTTGASQLDNNFCVAVCPGNSAQNCGGNPDRFEFYVLNGGTTNRGPVSSSLLSASRASASRASRSSVSSVASVSRASRSSVLQASRSSAASVRSSLSSVASASRVSVISSKSVVSASRSSARSSVAASRSSVTSLRSVATQSQQSSRSSRSSARSVATSSKLSSISSRRSSLSSSISVSRASVISRKSSSLNARLSSISSASVSRASVSSVRSASLRSAQSSRSAVSASRASASSALASQLAGNVYRAIGCYNHSAAQPALALNPQFTQMSNGHCALKCQKHLYMGLFNGDQCWCGDSIMQPAVNFSLCFFGYSQGCRSVGAYTQDCGSQVNMYILGKQSYFGTCNNTNPVWAGKCTPVTASAFSTTSTTVVAKRTALPEPSVTAAAVLKIQDDYEEEDENFDVEADDYFDELGHYKIGSIADIPPAEAQPTTAA